ncbi:MAG: hypothetical protein HQM16_05560 [Deltaproteobacteria bacterium]|nr:hypothetical protein [Deltaproteobacteria bacterium]
MKRTIISVLYLIIIALTPSFGFAQVADMETEVIRLYFSEMGVITEGIDVSDIKVSTDDPVRELRCLDPGLVDPDDPHPVNPINREVDGSPPAELFILQCQYLRSQAEKPFYVTVNDRPVSLEQCIKMTASGPEEVLCQLGELSEVPRLIVQISNTEVCDGINNNPDVNALTDEGGVCCGNGTVEGYVNASETCDEGPVLNGQPNHCNSTCNGITPAVCGNTIREAGESCDEGPVLNGQPNHCNSTCNGITPAVCGNTIQEAGETCDDGAALNGRPNQCNSTCNGITPSVCGNSVEEAGEACDDGNTITEACAYGRSNCTVCDAHCQDADGDTMMCGDGITDTPNEACDDDGHNGEPNKCNIACSGITAPACGNGVVEAGEPCDDGNFITNDACSNTCKLATCGDGVIQDPCNALTAFNAPPRNVTPVLYTDAAAGLVYHGAIYPTQVLQSGNNPLADAENTDIHLKFTLSTPLIAEATLALCIERTNDAPDFVFDAASANHISQRLSNFNEDDCISWTLIPANGPNYTSPDISALLSTLAVPETGWQFGRPASIITFWSADALAAETAISSILDMSYNDPLNTCVKGEECEPGLDVNLGAANKTCALPNSQNGEPGCRVKCKAGFEKVVSASSNDFTCIEPDACPADPLKTAPGACGCGVADLDNDNNGVIDCVDPCIEKYACRPAKPPAIAICPASKKAPVAVTCAPGVGVASNKVYCWNEAGDILRTFKTETPVKKVFTDGQNKLFALTTDGNIYSMANFDDQTNIDYTQEYLLKDALALNTGLTIDSITDAVFDPYNKLYILTGGENAMIAEVGAETLEADVIIDAIAADNARLAASEVDLFVYDTENNNVNVYDLKTKDLLTEIVLQKTGNPDEPTPSMPLDKPKDNSVYVAGFEIDIKTYDARPVHGDQSGTATATPVNNIPTSANTPAIKMAVAEFTLPATKDITVEKAIYCEVCTLNLTESQTPNVGVDTVDQPPGTIFGAFGGAMNCSLHATQQRCTNRGLPVFTILLLTFLLIRIKRSNKNKAREIL